MRACGSSPPAKHGTTTVTPRATGEIRERSQLPSRAGKAVPGHEAVAPLIDAAGVEDRSADREPARRAVADEMDRGDVTKLLERAADPSPPAADHGITL
jgi:hypothetical protein